jgi:transposase InsO family protein
MSHEGCRSIAKAFNALNQQKGESVGKTYVANTIKKHQLQIRLLRGELKNRPRRQGPRNLTWGMDLTFIARDKRSEPVLGILDHGTRALLVLGELRDRSTIGILRVLLDVIEKFGRPRFLRTDNDGVFASPFFSLALLSLGIRHQRTDPHCPWQNGRVERLFHSLKERLCAWWTTAGAPDDVQHDLDTFRVWYNHARPHQSLAGLTPAMAWDGVTRARSTRFYSNWKGTLAGVVSS